MGTFLWKDIIVLLRKKTELITLILMPLVLIVILGFALKGLLGGDTEALNMKVGIVNKDNEQLGIEEFINELEEMDLSEEVVSELRLAGGEISPVSLLDEVFQEEGIQDIMETENMDVADRDKAVAEGDVDAVLTIPEGFTYQALQKMLLNKGDVTAFDITINEYSSLSANVFNSIVEDFVRTLNFETAINRALGEEEQSISSLEEESRERNELGGIETVSTGEPISSFQYYTIGMAVMFVLFVASTIAGEAYVEKQQHVFNRILLSGKHPLLYLAGKMVSTTVIAFVQLVLLFSVSALIFQSFITETLEFWAGMAMISLFLSICVGSLATLLTSLTIRFNSVAFVYIFSGGLVTLFAFAGGSFFPTSQMPEVVALIGNWTPNGAALTSYMQWMQGFGLDTLRPSLFRIIGASILFITASLVIFPRRRLV
ncbi:multidrug ABC transporter permease [Salipaludibacillus neizhouensis]|uniref:Multidrug ABC transporter permease n=1 Tax=Salipaludibacillus neizhouensis TaxID=885475 RepID=A0A3A9K9F5_9BACI|nr:ABC transporter permease [Salipaludibacillus neizhouensis]RKL68158.1 multidrug ABC transporter permease [Salipaludibacillus neizhouensis]